MPGISYSRYDLLPIQIRSSYSFPIQPSTTDIMAKHIVPIDWQNEQCTSFSTTRSEFFQMRDRLRLTNKKYKSIKLKTAHHYWKFCFGDEIPFQSPLPSLEMDEQQQASNPLPTMSKMISLTQVEALNFELYL